MILKNKMIPTLLNIVPLITVPPTTNSSSSGGVDPNCPDPDRIPTAQEYKEALGGYGVAFVSIGSVLTIVLYGLFAEQVYFTFSNTHRVYRRHIYWLISVYPLVTLMSTLALVVPGAHDLCSAIKITYLSIGVGHFADLTLLMYGGEEAMVDVLQQEVLRMDVLPLCCFFRFLPRPKPTKWKLRFVYAMCIQMPYTQAFYYFLFLYLFAAQMSTRVAFAWLSSINIASFLTGVYALTVLNTLSFQRLQHFRYRAKSFAVKMLILTTKLQGLIFDIMGNNDVFPCLNTYITPKIYQNTVENSVFLIEMGIFGVFSYFMYRRVEFKDFNEAGNLQCEKEDDVTIESGGNESPAPGDMGMFDQDIDLEE